MIKLKDLLNEDYKQIVAAYVNDFEDRGLAKIKNEVPSDLKYTGIAYHLYPVKPKDIQTLLNGGTLNYPSKKILSWSKSQTGLAEVLYNLSADNPSRFESVIIIKHTIPMDKCIIDVQAFAEENEGLISDTQYANYEEEEEVITVNFLTTINKSMLDGYILNGKGTQLNEASNDKDIINQIEQKLLRFDLEQEKYYATERKKPGYKRELNRLLPIVKKIGIDKVKEIEKTVGNYTATGYGRMNKSLRADKLPPKASLIDQYIEIAPKFTGKELYRGIGRDLFQTIITAKSKNFIDKAFMSATTDYTTAEHFARRTGKGGVLVLTGAVNKAAQAPLPMDFEEGEAEFIFPRNTRIQILKIDGDVITAKVL